MEISMKDLREMMLGQSLPVQTGQSSGYIIGKPYNLMTVLGWYKGILIRETEKTLILTNASWVSETERFSQYVLDDSKVREEEPFHENTELIIERSSLIGGFQLPSITRKLK